MLLYPTDADQTTGRGHRRSEIVRPAETGKAPEASPSKEASPPKEASLSKEASPLKDMRTRYSTMTDEAETIPQPARPEESSEIRSPVLLQVDPERESLALESGSTIESLSRSLSRSSPKLEERELSPAQLQMDETEAIPEPAAQEKTQPPTALPPSTPSRQEPESGTTSHKETDTNDVTGSPSKESTGGRSLRARKRVKY